MTGLNFWQRSELTRALHALRYEFAVVGLFSLVANVLMLAPTLYMLQVYDRVLVSRSELTLLVISLITLFLFGMTALAEWSRTRLLVRSGVRLDNALAPSVFNASFADALRASSTDPGKCLSDLTELRQFLTGQGIFAFFDAPWTPVYIAVLFFLHPLLGWLAIGFAMVQALLAWQGHHQAVAPTLALAQLQTEAHNDLQGKLKSAEAVESMGMMHQLRARWLLRHQASLAQHAIATGLNHRLAGWSKLVRYSQQSLSLGAGALLVIDNQLSPGGMIAANVLMTRALAPIDQMVAAWRGLIGAHSAFERLERILAGPVAQRDPARTTRRLTGLVALRDVSASAPGRAQPILANISLRFEPGSINIILGASGSGKSTLARVLMGVWPDVKGEVLLDQFPLARLSREEIGPQMGYLPQDIALMEGTVAQNIARFAQMDSALVIGAAQAAGLHEMILRLPKGYDTPMGEAGYLLSGGQRQRIGLARALYGHPALVVLDEPNANLDEAGEQALIKALQELKAQQKTVVLITHRPGVLRVADQVLVLHEGRIHLQGARDTVMAQLQAARLATPAHPPLQITAAAV